jgi:hypothetical protein
VRRVTFTGIALATAIAVAGGAAADSAKKEKGKFETLPGGTSMGLEIDGIAQIKRTSDATAVKVHVRGLEPDTTYAAHLHNSPCSVNEGGGHYKDDPAGAAAPPNELWLSSDRDDPTAGITANSGGVAHGRGSADWVAREEAAAVVVHAIPTGGSTAGGPKIACADLE